MTANACRSRNEEGTVPETGRLPSWFRQEVPDAARVREMKERLSASGLHTVCESARCPNLGACWGAGVATFMILGDVCTRACRFCAVESGHPSRVDADEPRRVARAVAAMGLKYCVITSVTRDDLDDGGAALFAAAVTAVRAASPTTKIEVLIPDCGNDPASLRTVTEAAPEVIGHNLETVRRLSPTVRPQAGYDRSLGVLKTLKSLAPSSFIKSGLMVGLGETDDEIVEAMRDLVAAGCDLLTVGQYLAPTRAKRHVPVRRFVDPQTFAFFKEKGSRLGFQHVESAPLVRSSFIAERGYHACLKKARGRPTG